MALVATQKQVADHLKVTAQAVGQWAKKLGFPTESDGRFDTEKIQEWRLATRKQKPNRVTGKPSTAEEQAQDLQDIEAERLDRKLKNQERQLTIDAKAFALALKRQEYHPRIRTKKLLAIYSSGIRDLISMFRREKHEQCAEAVIEKIGVIERMVEEELNQLS
jgi:hypothetical protein